MKKILAFALLIATSTASLAQGYFYNKNIPGWTIVGRQKQNELNAVCAIEKVWNDGSLFTVFKDLNDGELYFLMTNNSWEIRDNPGLYTMRMNFHYSNGTVNGGIISYELLSKNTIRVRNLKANVFLNDFVGAKTLKFVMPGTIMNIEIPLNNSSIGIENMVDCVNSFKSVREFNSKGLDL